MPAADRIEKSIPVGKTVAALGNALQGVGYGLHHYAGPKPPKEKKHIIQKGSIVIAVVGYRE